MVEGRANFGEQEAGPPHVLRFKKYRGMEFIVVNVRIDAMYNFLDKIINNFETLYFFFL